MTLKSVVGVSAAVVAAGAVVAPGQARAASRSLSWTDTWSDLTNNYKPGEGDHYSHWGGDGCMGGNCGGDTKQALGVGGGDYYSQYSHDDGGHDDGGHDDSGSYDNGGHDSSGGYDSSGGDTGGGGWKGNGWKPWKAPKKEHHGGGGYEYKDAGAKVNSGFEIGQSDDSGDNGGGDTSYEPGAGKQDGGTHEGHGTWYEAIGIPISACGVPAHEYIDHGGKELPFGALNTNSMFENGKNCGRWVDITLGKNCKNSGHGTWGVCDQGGHWEVDGDTNKHIYVYISDMCPDENYWCKMDPGHIDISAPFLIAKGLKANWNGRKISWHFMNGAPQEYAMNQLKFLWKSGSKFVPGNSGAGFFISVAIANVDNGIGMVKQKMSSGGMKECKQLNELGQQYILNQDHGSDGMFELEVYDVDSKPYGTYKCKFDCGTGCSDYTKADCSKA